MTAPSPHISLILPAYNEAATIVTTVAEAAAYFQGRGWTYEIIVAADGDDGTREAARAMAQLDGAVKVIGEPGRRGKGKGIRDGVSIAAGSIIGFADADNKVPITEFDNIEPFLQQGIEVVVGSRALAKSRIDRKQRWYRRIGSIGFGYFLRAVLGLPGVRDTQCGFKFFPAYIAKDLFSRQTIDGYMFDVEILVLAQRLGYRIVEVPIRWSDDADSRLQLFSGNFRNMVDIFWIGLTRSRRRFPVTPDNVAASRADAS